MNFHPLFPSLYAIRELFLYGALPPGWVWIALVGWPVLAVAIGAFAFGALRDEIRDVI
jgi:ABC-type polysaccharide/polyol phosphate export permease